MSLYYKELDFRQTPLGDLMLRRRRMMQFPDRDIYEIRLNDEFLMTSLFHEAEDQLAHLALEKSSKKEIHCVVGGLGLGYTGLAALEDPRIASLTVVEYLEAVIEWHKEGLLPMGKPLVEDSRCEFLHADFFALCRDANKGFQKNFQPLKHDMILLDIDHSPSHVLNPSHSHFYSKEGLKELASRLNRGGVFGLWADGKPKESFCEHLLKVFDNAKAHTITFTNPITRGSSTGSVYIATVK